MARIYIPAIIAIVAIMLLTACSPTVEQVRVVDTVRVEVPIPTRRTPPAELLTPLKVALPVPVSPKDPKATSAYTPEGERATRVLLTDLLSRIRAWEAWAGAE